MGSNEELLDFKPKITIANIQPDIQSDAVK